MLSSHQDRIVELCAHKIDISDSKLFYYIKLRKIGNLGLDQEFSKHQIDKAHIRQRQYFDCLDSRNLCLASLEKSRKLLIFNFRGGI